MTVSIADMMFRVRLVPSIIGILAYTGVDAMATAKATTKAVLAAKVRMAFMVSYL